MLRIGVLSTKNGVRRTPTLSPPGRGENTSPFSRRVFAPELCFKLHEGLPKKGGGAPIGASTGCRISSMRRAPPSCPRMARTFGGGALAFRRSTAAIRRAFTPRLGPGRASWNHRMQTGLSLSGTSAASTSRSDHAPDGSMPRTARNRGDEPRLRDRTRSVNRPSPVTPFAERDSPNITETVTMSRAKSLNEGRTPQRTAAR